MHVALEARDLPAEREVRVRVVSLPSWEAFRRRPAAERDILIPPAAPTVSVEAGASQGWHEFADVVVGVDRFGLSAAGPEALAAVGVTAEAVGRAVERALESR